MHFATLRQIVAMAIAWAAFLVAYDQHASPKPLADYWAGFKGSSTRPVVVSGADNPRLRLSMAHLCCKECVTAVGDALKSFSWLGPARPASELPDAEDIDIDIYDLDAAELVTLGRALAGAGLAPDKIEVSGIGHFRFDVSLPSVCCGAERTLDEPFERFLRKETQGRWLDSVSVSGDRSLLVYARMNATADVVELTTALGRAGFAPHEIRILTGPE
jgi:hypothetical protein